MSDLISRQAAIDAIKSRKTAEQSSAGIMRNAVVDFCIDIVKKLPSAQPEPAIPISWLMEEIKRLESRKNCLTVIDVAQLKTHIKRWESEQNETN